MKVILATSLGLIAALGTIQASAVSAQSGGGRQGMIERFQMLDTNTDGQLSGDEAGEWIESVFYAMDADGDAQLTREEYMAIQLGKGADPDQRGPKYAQKQAEKNERFTAMDADSDGFVLQQQFFAQGQNDFAIADTDQNGSLSMPEFFAAHF